MNDTILMTEEFWANSQFSVARYCGSIQLNGVRFIIVNKEGKDIFECSLEAEKAGREKAIEPGEPADLIREDFQKFYRKLGRDRFIQIIKEHRGSAEQIKSIMKEEVMNRP